MPVDRLFAKRDIGELLVVPSLKAHRAASGNLVLTEKFISGMCAYAERWPGVVTVMVKVSPQPDSNLDHVEVMSHYPFNVEPFPDDYERLMYRLRMSNILLGGDFGNVGVRQIAVKEYSFNTRLQIIKASTPNPLRRWKRYGVAAIAALQGLRSARLLAGIQCNGMPAYKRYKNLNSNVMLFFDNRIQKDDLVPQDVLEQRTARLRAGAPLRLAFTGRLMPIKGVYDLPKIAAELRRRGVRFEMSICGGGECEQQLVKCIKEKSLCDKVHLRGILKYREELLPFVRENIDLFVCPHVQGDPSCTYLETMACGVPIVGYANEAWQGMVPLCNAGWTTPLKDPILLAAKIAELDENRETIAKASKAARVFAEQHLFERTMDRRIEHMLSCLDQQIGIQAS
jgi:colanic acid/amylovoran biosynthesis glycosyltransferase